MFFAPFSQDPLALAVGAAVPWLILQIIARPGMPVSIVYLFIWQWMQIFTRVLQSMVDNESMASGLYGPDVARAYWYMLASLVVMALRPAHGAGQPQAADAPGPHGALRMAGARSVRALCRHAVRGCRLPVRRRHGVCARPAARCRIAHEGRPALHAVHTRDDDRAQQQSLVGCRRPRDRPWLHRIAVGLPWRVRLPGDGGSGIADPAQGNDRGGWPWLRRLPDFPGAVLDLGEGGVPGVRHGLVGFPERQGRSQSAFRLPRQSAVLARCDRLGSRLVRAAGAACLHGHLRLGDRRAGDFARAGLRGAMAGCHRPCHPAALPVPQQGGAVGHRSLCPAGARRLFGAGTARHVDQRRLHGGELSSISASLACLAACSCLA